MAKPAFAIQPRNILSDVRRRRLIAALAPVLARIADEVGATEDEADIALTEFCNLCSRTTAAVNTPFGLLSLSDTPDELTTKCLAYLTADPSLLDVWYGAVAESERAPIAAPEYQPQTSEEVQANPLDSASGGTGKAK